MLNSSGVTAFAAFAVLLERALRRIAPQVADVHIMMLGLCSSLTGALMSFPCLKQLHTASSLTSPLISFISCHTTITSLVLTATSLNDSITSTSIILPFLTSLAGPPESMSIFIPSSQVTSVGIFWNACSPEGGSDCIIHMLTQSNRPITRLLSFSRGFEEDFFLCISKYLPSLEELVFGGFLPSKPFQTVCEAPSMNASYLNLYRWFLKG